MTMIASGYATWRRLTDMLDAVPQDVLSLCARIFPAAVFWESGDTKIAGGQASYGFFDLFHAGHWQVTDGAVDLFRTEYKLPVIDPSFAAHLAAFNEHFFPVLLVLGLFSRLAALALLGMTAVIEIFVYPEAWPTHGTWATLFLIVIARGPGRFSLDYLLGNALMR